MAVFIADEQSGDEAVAGPSREVDADRLRRLAEFVLADRGVPQDMDMSVLAVDVDTMTGLNRHHMGADGPTDVLAFPIDLPGETGPGELAILGDVILCPEIAERQAAEHGKTPQAEQDLLVVHGILHLLGHDHAEPDEREVMFSLTDRLLADFAAAETQEDSDPGAERADRADRADASEGAGLGADQTGQQPGRGAAS